MLFKRRKKLGPLVSYTKYRRFDLAPRRRRPLKKISLKPAKTFTFHSPRFSSGPSFLKRLFLILLSGALLILLCYFLFISDFFLIKKIELESEGEPAFYPEIESILEGYLNSNLILFDSDQTEELLKELHPEFSKLQIKKVFSDTLTVVFEEYPVAANLISKKGGFEKKYLINQNGLITEADAEQPDLPYIIIETDRQLIQRTRVIDPSKLEFILEAITDFTNKFGMEVFDARYLEIEREVHLWTERYFFIWLDLDQDLNEQLSKLKRALPKLNIYEEDLEYVDLRVAGESGEKIIFKRR